MKELTFYELTQMWQKTCLERKSIEVKTKEDYMLILNNRVLPVFGKTFINDISAMMLDNYVGDLIDKGYAAKTIRNTISVIKAIFRFAYRKDLIVQNPMDKMESLPQVCRTDKIHYFTPTEARIFLAEINKEDLEFRALFYLLLFSGCRRGEVCALRWEDIDFTAQTICIRRAVSYTKNGLLIKDPKTSAGNRTISLPKICFDLLKMLAGQLPNQLPNQEQAKAQHQLPDQNQGYVFADRSGRNAFIPPQALTDRFRAIIKRHNLVCAAGDELPAIRLHDLRHTSATLLVAQNVDVETVARRLGHANPSVTLNVYAHPTMEADYRASRVLGQILC